MRGARGANVRSRVVRTVFACILACLGMCLNPTSRSYSGFLFVVFENELGCSFFCYEAMGLFRVLSLIQDRPA